MTAHEAGVAARRRRAYRLMRWYPREWRSRYGEEFHELLVADMVERPRSVRRAVDVVKSGLLARLATTGLAGQPVDPARLPTRALRSLGAVACAFSVLALAIWAQVTIGWQWSEPATAGTVWGMVVMSAAVAVLGLCCLAGAVPAAWTAVARLVHPGGRSVVGPLLLVVVSLGVLVVGARHFANGWPGTGGHPWAQRGLVPGGLAAFVWAFTLFVTSYWVHPGALEQFPAAEVAWMLVSPVALVTVVVGVRQLLRRVDPSPRLVLYYRRLAAAVAASMALFVLGASLWVVDGGPGPRNLFHAGAIDVVELALLAVMAVVAARASSRSSVALGRSASR
jgi:hypothetical protein